MRLQAAQCPYCSQPVRVTAKGTLYRHGWKGFAWNRVGLTGFRKEAGFDMEITKDSCLGSGIQAERKPKGGPMKPEAVKKAVKDLTDQYHHDLVDVQERCPHQSTTIKARMDNSGQADKTCLDCGKLLEYGPVSVMMDEREKLRRHGIEYGETDER